MSLHLPEDKLFNLKEELQSFLGLHRASKRQLQSLAGRLSRAVAVVKVGEYFSAEYLTKLVCPRITAIEHYYHLRYVRI